MFNEYGIIYILADEEDVIKLRTNIRKEEVYLYQVLPKVGKEGIRTFFLYVMRKIQSFERNPRFYNTVTNNCLSSLLNDFIVANHRQAPYDIRIIKNGYYDELLYEFGLLDTWGLPFDELRRQRHINQYVSESTDNYSEKIRTPPVNVAGQPNQ